MERIVVAQDGNDASRGGAHFALELLLAVTTAFFTVSPSHARADEADARTALVHDERRAEPYSFRFATGLMLDLLPQRIVEAQSQQLPYAMLHARFALPYAFSIESRLSVALLYNRFELGPAWSLGVGALSFAIAYRIGIWFGIARLEGYDADAWGLTHTASFAFSFPIRSSRVRFFGELRFRQPHHIRFGSRNVFLALEPIAGPSVGVTIESPVTRHGYLYYGLTLSYATYDALAWLSFTDVAERALYPSLVVGYEY